MKNKITCLLAGVALFGATANAEIVLGDSLSAYGYIDMALTDGDGSGTTTTSVAEFELGFSFAPAESPFSAVAELSFGSADVEWETVTITYAASDALSFTAGNILTYQGFEAYDATGLYQFSYSGPDGNSLYSATYAVGASADYSGSVFDLGFWVGDTDADPDTGDLSGDMSYEYYVSYNGIENLSLNLILADDPGYDTTNIWASYDFGDFTFAVEYIENDFVANNGEMSYAGIEVANVAEYDAMMFMLYKAFGDAGLTLRYTEGSVTVGGVEGDYDKFTVSPSYAFSDNVFGLVEFSTEDLEGLDQDTAAVELIYSF